MIRYKVVRQHNRMSAIADGYFALTYIKGTTVKALPGTIGIAVFKTLYQARKWQLSVSSGSFRVIKVDTLGQGRRRRWIANLWLFGKAFYQHRAWENPKKWMEGQPDHAIFWSIPEGTLFYPAVKVLE